MKKIIILSTLAVFILSGCATWKGVKKDSSDAWDATKDGTSKAYKATKKSINNMTSE